MRTRSLLLALPLALASAAPVFAQASASSRSAPPPPPQSSTAQTGVIRSWLDSLARDPNGLTLSPAAVHQGAQTVRTGQTVPGNIAAWHGDLDVSGTVNGNAVAIGGNVILHPGAAVHGDVLAVGGEVRNNGGTVDGEMRAINALTVGPVPAAAAHRTGAAATRRSVSIAVGWYLVLAAIGLFVALFARRNLETIAERIHEDFSRAFLYGLFGQAALLPALVVVVVALAITILGIVLIPLAIIALLLAAAGALALGFLAMSFVTGDAAMRWKGAVTPYGPPPVLQLLLIGLSLYFVLWVLAGAFAWAGVIGGVLRLIVGIITWVAITVGFGATIASRGGTRSATVSPLAPLSPTAPSSSPARSPLEAPRPATPPAADYSWQTPTPVSGVAAARRPTPPPRPREP